VPWFIAGEPLEIICTKAGVSTVYDSQKLNNEQHNYFIPHTDFLSAIHKADSYCKVARFQFCLNDKFNVVEHMPVRIIHSRLNIAFQEW
jgi:hypothetical protein